MNKYLLLFLSIILVFVAHMITAAVYSNVVYQEGWYGPLGVYMTAVLNTMLLPIIFYVMIIFGFIYLERNRKI